MIRLSGLSRPGHEASPQNSQQVPPGAHPCIPLSLRIDTSSRAFSPALPSRNRTLAWTWGVVASVLSGAGRYLAAAPLLAVALVPLAFNRNWASRADDWAAHDWAWDLLTSVEPYGIIFTT